MPVSITRSYDSSSRYGSSYSPSSYSSTYRSALPTYRSNTYSSSYRSTSGIDSFREKSTDSSYSSRKNSYSSYRSTSGLDSTSREKSDSTDSAYSSTSKVRDYSKSRSLGSADGNLKTNNLATRRSSSSSLYTGSSLDISRYSLSNYVSGTARSSSTSRPPRYSSVRDNASVTTSTSTSPSTTLRATKLTDQQSARDLPAEGNVPIEQLGLTGLANLGNTCFLNSTIQCLSNTKVLLEYIRKNEYNSELKSSSRNTALMSRLADVIKALWLGDKTPLVTHQFKSEVEKVAPRFLGYLQQDAQEFLRYLLEGLHNELNRALTPEKKVFLQDIDENLSDSNKAVESWKRYLRNDNSKIVDTFGGMLKSTLKCTHCGYCSTTFEPFWDLSLPIPNRSPVSSTLSHCLELFTKEEVLDGEEMPTCSKCKERRRCIKRILIQKFPEVLVIHLKRFSLGGRSRKVHTLIDFPATGLNMAEFSAENQLRDIVYDLYGVINHSGSCSSGHYFSYCKHPYSGEWHVFNDERVREVEIIKNEAYVLFYEQTPSTRL